MDNEAKQPSASGTNWTPTQTYSMAAVCLVIGVLVGYLVRGSAHPATQATPTEIQQAASAPPPGMPQATSTLPSGMPQATSAPPPGMGQQKVPTLDDMKRMTDKQVEPLLAKLKTDPKNVTIRTVMASCMYYTGDVDGALAELNKSLTYDPKHAGTLMNIGIIKWHGKNDVNGAVAAWQTLLKLNPNFPQKDVIEHLITEAKQHQSTATAASPGKG